MGWIARRANTRSVRLPEPAESFVDLPRRSAQALVLERHPATRIGFGLVLRSQPWIERCLLSSDREEAVAIASRMKPDVAIVDVTEAGPFVSSYIAPLHNAHPAMSLLLSTRDGSSALVKAPLPPDAAGLITPAQSIDEVVSSVRRALVGQAVPDPVMRRTWHELSAREHEVLMLLSTGATNREIAETLHVSTETVKKHAATLYRKLGVRNRTEAAQLAS
jgi:DNA-binding NarL/FixJ family response regulator